MSEKSKPNKKMYTYQYIQFTATSREKKQIKHFANKENFKTTSEFVRRIVFDYIRRQENPELFYSANTNSINPLKMEYRVLRSGYGDAMLIEYEKWTLNLNHAYRKSLYISKHNDRTYHYSEPEKNLDILQEFLEMIKERCKDAGLNIT